jgi:hypothetical protein
MTISAEVWYEQQLDLTSYYQGDIIRDVPVLFLPDKISKWFLLRPGPKSPKLVDDILKGEICKWLESTPEGQLKDRWQHGDKSELVAAMAQLNDVIILTQTCDIQNRSFYQIAPVFPESKLKQSALQHLRENDLQYAFYLPAVPPYVKENSYADLSYSCAVPKAYFPKDLVQARLAARLTNIARIELQSQLLNYFGRPFGFGARDRAITKGEYGCVACFFRFGKSVKLTFEAGANFGPCPECNQTLWIAIP